MIIKCPECETSFLVPQQSLSPNGRRVKCSACHTQWFQKFEKDEPADNEDDVSSKDTQDELDEPTDEESVSVEDQKNVESEDENLSHDDDVALDDPEEDVHDDRDDDNGEADSTDIPEGVKPDSLDDDMSIPPVEFLGKHTYRLCNYGYATLCLFFMLGVFSLSGSFTTKIWPESIIYYRALGLNFPLPGEDISFDQVKASVLKNEDDTRFLKVQGTLINLHKQTRDIPTIYIDIFNNDQSQILESWNEVAPQERLEGELSLPFSSSGAQNISPEATRINVRFGPAP